MSDAAAAIVALERRRADGNCASTCCVHCVASVTRAGAWKTNRRQHGLAQSDQSVLVFGTNIFLNQRDKIAQAWTAVPDLFVRIHSPAVQTPLQCLCSTLQGEFARVWRSLVTSAAPSRRSTDRCFH